MISFIKKKYFEVETGSNRQFGFVMSAFFLILSFGPLVRQHQIRTWTLLPAFIFLLGALAFEKKLEPLQKSWMIFGLLLKNITTPIILLLMFFLVFFPIAMFLKLFKKDILNLKNVNLTNWKICESEEIDFKEQF